MSTDEKLEAVGVLAILGVTVAIVSAWLVIKAAGVLVACAAGARR